MVIACVEAVEAAGRAACEGAGAGDCWGATAAGWATSENASLRLDTGRVGCLAGLVVSE